MNINQETKWISPKTRRETEMKRKNCAPPTTTQPFVWNSGLKLDWRYSQSSNNYVIIFLEKHITHRLKFVLAWSRCLNGSESYRTRTVFISFWQWWLLKVTSREAWLDNFIGFDTACEVCLLMSGKSDFWTSENTVCSNLLFRKVNHFFGVTGNKAYKRLRFKQIFQPVTEFPKASRPLLVGNKTNNCFNIKLITRQWWIHDFNVIYDHCFTLVRQLRRSWWSSSSESVFFL